MARAKYISVLRFNHNGVVHCLDQQRLLFRFLVSTDLLDD